MKYLAFSIVVIVSLHLATTIDVSVHALCPDKALDLLGVVDEILKGVDFEILGREEDSSKMISKLSGGEIDSILVCNSFVLKLSLKKSLPLSRVRFMAVGRSSGIIGTLHGFEYLAFREFGSRNLRFYRGISQMKEALLKGEIEGVFLPETASRYIEDGIEKRNEWSTCVLVFSDKVPDEIILEINSAILKAYQRIENPPNEITLQVLDRSLWRYVDEGIWTGQDAEKVRKIFSNLGYRVKLVSYPRLRAFEYLKKGLIDGVFLVERTPDFEKFLEFIDVPIRSGSDVIFTMKSFENDFEPSSGMFKACGIVKGYSYEDLLKDFCEKFFKLKDVATGLKLLKIGRIDAFVTDYSSGSFKIEELGLEGVVHSSSIRDYEYYLALSRRSPHIALIPFIETELRKLGKKSGR